jgi:N-acetylglucosaminyldiphosphoundecaprenol N-acetyl-beta-D-mannosaminyltransferase
VARQDCDRVLVNFGLGDAVRVVTTDPCGISRARNEGLQTYFASTSEMDEDILCFPDDDCGFALGFGAEVCERFSLEKTDLAIMPYAPETHLVDRTRWPLHLDEIRPTDLMRVTSSAGIYVRATCLESIGGFDEQFGVGGPLSAGEDIDFVLRACRLGLQVCYWGDLAVLHEYKKQTPTRQVGNFALIRRHRDVLPPLAQSRAFARMVQSLVAHTGIRAFSSVKISLQAGLRGSGSQIPLRRSIGGLQIETSVPAELINRASDYVIDNSDRTRYVVAGHITALNHATSSSFRKAFNQADITMVDGISLSLISWLTPGPRLEKLATTDFAPAVFAETASRLGRPVRVGIIGGQEQIAEKAAVELDRSPEVRVVYSTHGYWEDFSAPISELNASNPDILILGLGMPLEARWLQQHRSVIQAPLVITCGGWLRLIAKVEDRAPLMLQKLHLEWLWRLVTDPKRTAPRYTAGVRAVGKAIVAPWLL